MSSRSVCSLLPLLLVGLAACGGDKQGSTRNATGSAPPGYRVVGVSESGKKLVTYKTEAVSAPAARQSTIKGLSQWFDGRPVVQGAFADAREHRWGGAPFTAKLKGQPMKGLILCSAGEKGADVAVAYCRADAPASEWAKLNSARSTVDRPAAAAAKTTEYAFPDGTGSVQLPEGWTTSARSCIQGVRITGPAGQIVTWGSSVQVNTPDSFIVQNHRQMEANARQMGFPPPPALDVLVAPFTGPAEALRNLVPQFSLRNQRNGGPAIAWDKFLEAPVPDQPCFPNGQAAWLSYAVFRGSAGAVIRYRALARAETWLVGPGAWSLYMTELAAPDATFDKDLPVMRQIVGSFKLNSQAVQRETARTIANMNQQFRAYQRANATRQQGFEDYFQSMQRNCIVRDRAAADFDEVIRGQRTVMDATAGERRSVDLGNVNEIVEDLNRGEPGRYVQIPLREEVAPLPPEPKR